MTDVTNTWWRSIGESIAGDPGQWEFQSRLLLRSGSLCMEAHRRAAEKFSIGQFDGDVPKDLGMGIIASFLTAQGIEVLLKAIALRQDPTLARTGRDRFYSHNVATLAMLAGVTLSADETRLVEKLTALIEWAGRYPVPKWDTEKGRTKYDIPVVTEGGRSVVQSDALPWSVEWEDANRLAIRLRKHYYDEP